MAASSRVLAVAIEKARKRLSAEANSRLGELIEAKIDDETECVRISWEAGSHFAKTLTEAEVRPKGEVWILRLRRGRSAREFGDISFRPLSRLEALFSSRETTPAAQARPVDFSILDTLERIGKSSDLAERLQEVVEARDLDEAG